jgi:hypothetical protein
MRAHQFPARRLPPQRAPKGWRRQVAPLHWPNDPTGVFGDLGMPQSHCAMFVLFFYFFFCEAHYSSLTSSRSSPAPRASSVATVVSSLAPAAEATVLAVAVEAAPELVASGTPQTPEGVLEDVLEDPVDVPEMVPSPSPEEVLAEKAMLVVCAAVPSSPLAAAEASSSAPGTAAPADAAADAVGDRRWSWGTPPAMLQATFPWMGL